MAGPAHLVHGAALADEKRVHARGGGRHPWHAANNFAQQVAQCVRSGCLLGGGGSGHRLDFGVTPGIGGRDAILRRIFVRLRVTPEI
jgi:hypothetical protein